MSRYFGKIAGTLALTLFLAAGAAAQQASTTYEYDDLGRLKKVTHGTTAPTDTYVYDATGNRASRTVAGVGTNQAPVATADSSTVALNTAKTLNVRSNDTDADGDGLKITSVTTPGHGTATNNGGVNVTYTPSTGYTGADSFSYTISDGRGGQANANVSITVSNASTTVYSIADQTGTEGTGNIMTFTVSRTGAPIGVETIQYATSSGTATSGSDFTAASGTLTFQTGDSSKTFNVTLGGDANYEGTETYTVTLSNNSAGTISDATAIGTINDNDTPPSFSVSSASASEGDVITFTVTKSGSTTISHDINYATSSGTAISGTDFAPASGTLTFTSGQTSRTFTVNTTEDSSVESNETFTVTLSSATGGATIGTSSATGTINDDDGTPPPSFAINNSSATEGSAITFTVTKTGTTSSSFSVNYASSSGTATSGTDFTAVSGTLTFTSAQTTKTFTVSTTNDSTPESNETLNITLSNATGGATITDSSGVGTINDNDSPSTLTSSSGTVLSGHTSTYDSSMSCSYIGYPLNGDYCTYLLTLDSTSATRFSAFGLQTSGTAISTTSISTGYTRPSSSTLVITVTPAQYGQ